MDSSRLTSDKGISEDCLNLSIWAPVKNSPCVKDIGNSPYKGAEHVKEILALFDGIERT